ncbi:MAG: hypothetical protein O2955_19735 [Planctomycetota bacterium]|nr:hypothetical protein [Planctomycetota bacterium]MDA1214746.1 hypothetical protein [Planctomycetota bacterium]
MRVLPIVAVFLLLVSLVSAGELSDFYFHSGPRAGTLTSAAPLPLYDADPQHLWNRLFAAFYIRPRVIPANDGEPEFIRYEGGDVIEFLAWGKTEYWSSEDVFAKINPLLDEFLDQHGTALIGDPLKRALFQHDVWAVYDHLIGLNIRRLGDKPTRDRRTLLCDKLAHMVKQLALSADELNALPDTYTLAVKSGAWDSQHEFDASRNYLPSGLLENRDEWVEIDFHQPKVSSDISARFITLHARSLRGRSYYRIFYRFPEGRQQVLDYLKRLDENGIDWKQAANNGFVRMGNDVPQIPVGTEVVLLQFMMSLDNELRPTPTKVVESFQFRAYANLDGAIEPPTNTGVGVNVLDYRLKRHLLFDNYKHGGLEREPEAMPQYRVAIDGNSYKAPDWGFADKTVLFQQCVDCHMSRNLDRLGVASIPSIIHSGGFDAGAQMGVVHPVEPGNEHIRGERVAKYKSHEEGFRRLLEFLDE